MACGGSAKASAGLHDDNEYSIMGRAEHMCQEFNRVPADAPDEVRERFDYCQLARRYLFDGYTVHAAEHYLESDKLTGTIDLILVKNNSCDDWVLIDWKFGRVPVSSTIYQMSGYAWLMYDTFPASKRIRTCIIQPRLKREFSDIWVVNHTELDCTTRVTEAIARHEKGLRTPHAEACRYCPAKWNNDRCKEFGVLFDGIAA